MSLSRSRLLVAAGVPALVLGALAVSSRDSSVRTTPVRRDDLILGVEVEGELAAVRSIVVSPPAVPDIWEYKITFLAPESAFVKKGDPLVSFDAAPLRQQLEAKTAEYEESSKKIERKELELSGKERDLELQLANTESQLQKLRLKYDVPEDLRSRNEVRQTALELKSAEQALSNLKARIVSVRASEAAALRSLRSQRDRARGRVAELRAGIEAMTVRAPQDGVVIFKTGWRDEKKKVGDSAWFGEQLVELPDLGGMRAEGDVDEADAGLVQVGQRATLRLEALPDRDIAGTVSRIARAVRRKSWRVPTKVFRVRIDLDTRDPALRPAMRFRGEIETGRRAKTLVVPRDVIFLRPSGPVAWVKASGGFREQPVKIGSTNARFVEILGGLSQSDVIALTDLAAESP